MSRTHLCKGSNRSRRSSCHDKLDDPIHDDDLDGEPHWHSVVRMEGQRSLGSLEFQGHNREERAEPDNVQVLAREAQVHSTCGTEPWQLGELEQTRQQEPPAAVGPRLGHS